MTLQYGDYVGANSSVPLQQSRVSSTASVLSDSAHLGVFGPTQGGGSTTTATRPQIRRGSTGEHVTYFQQRLFALGCRLTIDGIFGPGTESAARSFQRANGLTADGIVGAMTWAALG
ncbi:peptidoglycan-binding domain-containing protein [Arthrobacter sp. Soil736]|uniref:peptidoglycan-binding domain-containing protein n=1 Tax=Arthrobacter sp. Soil736 TaxID=1736395 RepID=UPI001F1228A9|nr:peptidoglycan-binding domain-containing protein [Arthrobacter sp. Soil736]